MRARSGFTLVELLVVMGIVALLIGLALPALSRMRQHGRGAACLGNLRQMSIAAFAYATAHQGVFPLSQWRSPDRHDCWDLSTVRVGDEIKVEPGLLWQGDAERSIQQCPEYTGPANWGRDPFTGYNYNTSYIGGGFGENRVTPASLVHVKRPAQTVLFGDGQWKDGANKFMRAPRDGGQDTGSTSRTGGTQGYRHTGATHVAFVDGRAQRHEERSLRYDHGGAERELSHPSVGFLGPDNALYDLR